MMMIVNVIAAPHQKRAIWYDPHKNDLIVKPADLIGLIELENPDNPSEIATVAMYMTCDHLGVYGLPQLDVNFLEMINANETLDIGKYTQQIEGIKELYAKIKAKGPEIVEVETEGNVSKIKRIIRQTKPETPTHEN